jgi:hypothetical protein
VISGLKSAEREAIIKFAIVMQPDGRHQFPAAEINLKGFA